jgi:hypothetical protein
MKGQRPVPQFVVPIEQHNNRVGLEDAAELFATARGKRDKRLE